MSKTRRSTRNSKKEEHDISMLEADDIYKKMAMLEAQTKEQETMLKEQRRIAEEQRAEIERFKAEAAKAKGKKKKKTKPISTKKVSEMNPKHCAFTGQAGPTFMRTCQDIRKKQEIKVLQPEKVWKKTNPTPEIGQKEALQAHPHINGIVTPFLILTEQKEEDDLRGIFEKFRATQLEYHDWLEQDLEQRVGADYRLVAANRKLRDAENVRKSTNAGPKKKKKKTSKRERNTKQEEEASSASASQEEQEVPLGGAGLTPKRRKVKA